MLTTLCNKTQLMDIGGSSDGCTCCCSPRWWRSLTNQQISRHSYHCRSLYLNGLQRYNLKLTVRATWLDCAKTMSIILLEYWQTCNRLAVLSKKSCIKSTNESVYLQWSKWHCHCEVHCRCIMLVAKSRKRLCKQMSVIWFFLAKWQWLSGSEDVRKRIPV